MNFSLDFLNILQFFKKLLAFLNTSIKKSKRKILQIYLIISYKYKIFNHANNLPSLNLEDNYIVQSLQKNGIFVSSLEDLSLNLTSKIHLPTFHQEIPVFHPNFSQNIQATKYRSETILKSYPDIFLAGLDKRLLDIAENYIGLPVAYHGADCRRYVANSEEIGSQVWHKDLEDRRILKILIYLNNVSMKNGPFEYIPKHLEFLYQILEKSYRLVNKINSVLPINIFDDTLGYLLNLIKKYPSLAITGSALTIVFVDTKRLLRRNRMPQKQRISLFYIYTSINPQQPDICAANFDYDREHLLQFEKVFPRSKRMH